MRPFTTVTGPAAPLLAPNVDTDVIVRIERLTGVAREALGPYAFESLRYRADGSEDPGFVLHRAPFRGAPILLTGSNFGCGSSREGAVWALQGLGIRCVVGTSFGDIFHANCLQNGVLPVLLDAATHARVCQAAAGGAPLEVDLRSERLVLPGGVAVAFTIDPLKRAALLAGLDEIGQTLRHAAAIEAWQARDRLRRPWLWRGAAPSASTTTSQGDTA